jgi:hypothetical protein
LENKNIEKIDLGCTFKYNQGNDISPHGCLNMKESLLKNKNLKNINLDSFKKFEKTEILDNEFHLVYQLLNLTQDRYNFHFSKNIYFSEKINIKLNYLKCFIDHFDHLFFKFHFFDILFEFQK